MPSETIAESPRESTNLLKTISALLSIVVILLAGAFWIFNVNAKADGAIDQSKTNSTQIEKKADKDDVKEGFRSLNEKIDRLQDYLMRESHHKGN